MGTCDESLYREPPVLKTRGHVTPVVFVFRKYRVNRGEIAGDVAAAEFTCERLPVEQYTVRRIGDRLSDSEQSTVIGWQQVVASNDQPGCSRRCRN